MRSEHERVQAGWWRFDQLALGNLDCDVIGCDEPAQYEEADCLLCHRHKYEIPEMFDE